ncbi:MAG: hypothetical protein WB988_02225 [Candidatus Nitrosopolaris sp.]|jgi:hypothetical protein
MSALTYEKNNLYLSFKVHINDVQKPKHIIQDAFAAEAEWIIHEENVVKRLQRHLNNNNELEASSFQLGLIV